MKKFLTTLWSLSTIIILSNITVQGQGFTNAQFEVANFGYNTTRWRVENNLRYLADVNGDGRADIVGFGYGGVFVSYATAGNNFTVAERKLKSFGYNNTAGGWFVDRHPRHLADVNGDGRADIVGFANEGVYVSFSTGSGFTAPELKLADFGYDIGGWRVEKHPRYVADVNGDGRADIVGFADNGVHVAYSTGSGFSAPELEVAQFGYGDPAGGWRVENHPRYVADVNGDGRADIVGFGNAGVYVSYAVAGNNFTVPQFEVANFGYDEPTGGWRVEYHPRYVADVNGDGRADIVGFGGAGVYVSYAIAGNNFTVPQFEVASFGYDEPAGGWRVENHPRYVADVNGDGRADIVGFADAGVVVSYAVAGNNFTEPQFEIAQYGYDAGGWRVENHPRYVTDVNGDGWADIVGFADAGVYVSYAIVPSKGQLTGSADLDNIDKAKISDEPSSEYKLRINPNPVISQTIIEYVVEEEGPVNLSLYDTKGALVAEIINVSAHKPGTHTAAFDPSSLSGGVYVVKMAANGNKVLTKSIVYQK